MTKDPLRDTLARRALALGLTAQDIARRCDNKPHADHVNAYFTGRQSMGSAKIGRVMAALGMTPQPENKEK